VQTNPTARRHLLTILATWLLLYGSFTLFTPPLLDDADSVHAEVAREMVQRHDWVTLYANGIRYLEKAPVLYWSMAASFKLFGTHDWAARLPLALGLLALLLIVYRFGRQAFSERTGFYAAMILATTPGCFIYTRFLIPDVLVCLWLTLAVYGFWRTEQQEQPALRNVCLFAAACALGVLTKGLIGIVFPVGIVLVYLLMTRGLRGTSQRLLQLHPIARILVFFGIAAPWHILAGLRNPTQGHIAGVISPHWFRPSTWIVPQPTPGNVHGWFWFYFVNEHLLRYLNLRVPRDYDTVPLWLFWGLLFVWLMPWSIFLLAHSVSWKRKRSRLAGTPLLLLVWAAAVMLFFSFSTRQEYYALPALPALALLIGHWLAEDHAAEKRRGQRMARVLLLFGMLGALAAGTFLLLTKAPGHQIGAQPDLASLLTQNPADYALSLGHFLDLNSKALGLFRLPLVLTALTLAAGTLANFIARRRNRPALGNASLFGMMIVLLLAAQIAFSIFNPVLGSEKLAQAIAAQHPTPQDIIAIHGEYESGSTLGFYLQRNDIHIVDGRSSNLWYGSFFPDAPPIFEDAQSITAKWSGPQRIFMWNDPSDTTRPLPQLAPVYVIAKSGGKEILSNQPAQ